MPVDLTKSHADRRRVNRDAAAGVRQDGMYSREIEMKRNRGEISCAECRRLKIKCDKQIPCQSCQRRGCASLCPNGSLATGQGTRFVIAATEHLHRRIARMGDRIRQLEDALAVLQATSSKEPHPLLCENAIIVDSESPDDRPLESEDEGATEVSAALGTLSVSDHGVSRFFGSTGGSDLLLLDNDDSAGSPSQKTETTDSSKGSNLPPQLQRFSYSFPFTPMGPIKDTIALIRTYLPPWEQAMVMAESYLETATWVFRSVTRHQLINEMLPSIYGKRLAYPSDDYNGPHDLALLFSMFALGSVLDVTLSSRVAESEGEHYNQLALAALGMQPVLEKPSLVTIQTLHIVSIYHAMLGNDASGGESSMEFTWSLVNLAAHLAQTIGLHRDPAQWEKDPRIVQRRRMVFWDLFVADSWHSLSTGRPPAFSREFIDCKFPQEDDLPTTLEAGDNTSLATWMFRFSNEVVSEIVARTLTATSPRYHTIKELDRKIRAFILPPQTLEAIRGGPGVDPHSVPLSASMLTYMLGAIGDIMLLFLHRNLFVQALIEDPDDPIRSQYAPSFLATVRAARNILQSVEGQLRVQRVIVSRFWTIWTYTFSATVVFAFIATRGPRSSLANDAMAELDKGCSLIGEAAKDNRRAAKALVILNRMREKARHAMATARDPNRLGLPDNATWVVKQEENDDEFTVFAGRSKVFRPGASTLPVTPPAPSVIGQSPDEAHPAHAQAHAAQAQGPGPSMLGEWLSRQEQYVGYDPHFIPPIETAPHAPHHQHQHQQYGYTTPERPQPQHQQQPQYTLETVPPLSQYMPASYQYTPPPQGLLPQPQPPSSTTPLGPPQGPHGQHPHPHQHPHPQAQVHPHQQAQTHPHQQHDDMVDLRRSYAAFAPQSELSQLGLAANGSRVNDTWMSFMHQHSGMLEAGAGGASGRHM